MRVLALTNMYPPHHYGGYELSCWDVMRRWEDRGHTVSVLTSDIRVAGVADPPGERRAGIRRDLRMYWDDHVLLSPPVARRLAIERHNLRHLLQALDDTAPDVVSVWNMGAMSLGLLTTVAARRVPMVLNLGDDWLAYGPRLDAWARLWTSPRRRLLARAVTAATGVPTVLPDLGALGACCFNSEATRTFAREQTPWTFPRTGVVYSGIALSDFPVLPEGAPVPERPWRGRLLYVGRIDERKGIDTPIRALTRLPGCHLRVVGRGDEAALQDLRGLVNGLGLADRVDIGPVERSELGSVYRAADALVFPSIWAEPFGLVPLEAMACDTPVVGTGTGGSGEFLLDGVNCLRYPPGDDEALAAAVNRLSSDADLRASLIRAGRGTAAEMTTDALADILEAWHRAAADGYPSGSPEDRRYDPSARHD